MSSTAGRTGTEAVGGTSRRRFIGAVATAAASVAVGPAAGPALPAAAEARPRGTRPLFLGAYTSVAGGGSGIGLATYDDVTGRITATGTLSGVSDPSFLAVHPSRRTLYTVNEQQEGGVTAVRLSPDGHHHVLGTRPTGGAGPCHLSVHPSGHWLLSANYLSGSVAVHPIDASGALGARTALVTHSTPPPGPGQDGPHAHQIVTSPDGAHVLAVDLGNDTVYTYRLDTSRGSLTRVSYASLRPGAGPRHLTFHPAGRFAYLANEVDNTVVVCAYDPATGRLTPGAPAPTGAGPGTSYPAQLVVTGDGRYAFLANRGHNSLTRYAIEGGGSRLRLLGTVPVGGDFPRHIALSPSENLLFAANQRSSSVSVFQVDHCGGELRPVGSPFSSPVAVCALPLELY
ncbi:MULTISPECIES: lactonase family protein [unclassified Streptomyces]|uniref:lactonase family protein n=1 Tax=unclassified Streptomyces TaxID=2593676 RepID=UPI002DDB81D2|nr:lactonase family protein [Streptomyces sp. NBC_01750]WSB04504.1 lactonase family protein [Streptomyces sp. NBC_01794]WSD31213.1 lactonase family protein [Streptomyces sp. NBC_01750]